jgi:16S rRNA processing protein RimM
LVEKVQTSGNSTVLKLASVDTEDQANALRGQIIEMDAAALPSPPAGVYYHYQIIGARVVTVAGEELGTVTEILETGSNDVYVVRAEPRPGQKAAPEILVPALKDVVLRVDAEHGVIEVDLPEGLR